MAADSRRCASVYTKATGPQARFGGEELVAAELGPGHADSFVECAASRRRTARTTARSEHATPQREHDHAILGPENLALG
jgi:hypothetical protein